MSGEVVASGGGMAGLQEKFDVWFKRQPPVAEVAIVTLGGAAQGAALGGIMGWVSGLSPPPAPGTPGAAMQNPAMLGGPLIQARNFAVLTGVNAGLNAAIKKWRGGVDDVKTAMGASFGSGVAFSLVSGIGASPQMASTTAQQGGPIPAALITGTLFALFQGAFYQIGKKFFSGDEGAAGGSGSVDMDRYVRTKYMLSNLGMEQYEKNFKKGQLDDSTLLLLNDSALSECKIPPGPRLLILHHLDGYKNILKPGAAMPMPPPPPPPAPVSPQEKK